MDSNEENLLAIAAAAEASSEHPLAQAVVTAAFDRKITPSQVDRFMSVLGRGVSASIGGATVLVGSPDYLIAEAIAIAPLAGRIRELEEAGRTVIAVADHSLRVSKNT